MTENDNKAPPVVLDEHRGMASQRETDARRHRSEVEADQAALHRRRTEFEKFLFAAPAADWPDAAQKALYLLRLFATTSDARDPRLKHLIEDAMADLNRLIGRMAGHDA
jgi:hypothetical protein